MRSRRRSALAATVAIGLGSLSLVACSSSTDSATETPATEAPAAASAEAAPASETSAPAEAAAPADTTPTTMGSAAQNNIFFTAVGAGNFLTLAKLLANADLIETIKGPGPFTVFAPTDGAFAKVPAETLNAIAADKEKLTKVLLYHVVPGALKSTDLKSGDTATAEGSTLKVAVAGGKVTVNDVNVVAADVVASNGVIHIIDSVLLPPDLG